MLEVIFSLARRLLGPNACRLVNLYSRPLPLEQSCYTTARFRMKPPTTDSTLTVEIDGWEEF
eukprot:2481542-Rhodomonas_salina.4